MLIISQCTVHPFADILHLSTCNAMGESLIYRTPICYIAFVYIFTHHICRVVPMILAISPASNSNVYTSRPLEICNIITT